MEMGTVKWFNNAKGFGFICPEGGGEDIFAHYSTIQMDGYRTLPDKPFGLMLIVVVHPANKMPVLLTGILFARLFSRRASTGSSRAALRAGSQPNSTPVSVEQRNAVSSASGENQSPSREKQL